MADNPDEVNEKEVAEALESLKPEEEPNYNSMPWVERGNFNMFMGLVIIANAICIGIEADDQKQNIIDGKTAIAHRMSWYIIELVFLTIFLAELFARLFYTQLKFFRSSQNWLDFILVVLNIADTLVMQPMGAGGDLRMFTIMRVVRILRLVRLVRVLKVFHQLHLLVSGLSNAMRTLLWVGLMLFICLYTCAIFVTLTIGHADDSYNDYFLEKEWDHERFFGNIWRSMFTLFQILTLDHWAEDVVRHVGQVQPLMVWFFLAFVLFSTYGLLNLVVGVIVESTLTACKFNAERALKKKQNDKKQAMHHIKTAFEQMDEDGSGTLSIDELTKSIENPEIATRLRTVDFPLDDPGQVLMLIDVEGKGELDIDSFIKGCMRLSGQAQSKDILEVLINVGTLGKHLTQLEEKILLIEEKTTRLDDKTALMVQQASEMFSDQRVFNRMKRMKVDLD